MACLLVLVLVSVSALVTTSSQPLPDTPYVEYVPTRFTALGVTPVNAWPILPVSAILQLLTGQFDEQIGTWMLASDALYFAVPVSGVSIYSNLQYTRIDTLLDITIGPNTVISADQYGNLVSVAVSTGFYQINCQSSESCKTVDFVTVPFGSVTCAGVSAYGIGETYSYLYFGTSSGLYIYDTGNSSIAQLFTKEHITALTVRYTQSASGDLLPDLAVGSASYARFYYSATQTWRWEWVTFVPTESGAPIDAPITAMAFDNAGRLWIGNNACINILFPNYMFVRLAGRTVSGVSGLPYGNITSLVASTSTYAPGMWIGTRMGIIFCEERSWQYKAGEWRMDSPAGGGGGVGESGYKPDSPFHYFYGARWHPGQGIVSSATALGDMGIIAVDSGLAIIQTQLWTLEQKAGWYEQFIPMLNRHNLINGCSLSQFGNLSTCVPQSSDNDGLWTSILVAAESFRYAVTGDPHAKAEADNHFQGMRSLNLATGIKGLMARSIVAPNEKIPSDGHWYPSTYYPGWYWKGDTSSDEVCGHMFAYPIYHDLAATTTSQKRQSLELIEDIVGYIVKNNFTLIDITGKPTTWGRWDPRTLNTFRNFSDEHGVNAVQMLAFILSAQRYTGKQMFTDAYNRLVGSPNNYDINIVNAKITVPGDDNYSDDELTFLPYYTFFNSTDDPDVLANAILSLDRTFGVVRRERADLWNIIYEAIQIKLGNGKTASERVKDPYDPLQAAVWNLQTWALELIDWPGSNSQRRDLDWDPEVDRFGGHNDQSLTVIPANERNQMRWNGNPYDVSGGGSGTDVTDPNAWLLPYWMARYYQLIAPASFST